MPGNRRRNANAVPLAMMASWVTVCLALTLAGLSYVWVKNDLHSSSRAIKDLERELATLRDQNKAALVRVAEASSTHELGKLFNERNRFSGLKPIDDARLVAVAREQRNPSDLKDDIRKVANPEAGPR